MAVGRNDAVVYERGYGMVNLELGVPIGATSVFETASISKAFTAMSILLLAQQGRLSPVLCNLDEIGWIVGGLARSVARLYLDGAKQGQAS